MANTFRYAPNDRGAEVRTGISGMKCDIAGTVMTVAPRPLRMDAVNLLRRHPRQPCQRRTSSFFIDRFANMLFSILTLDLMLHWNRNIEHFGPGLSRPHAPSEDAVENWWQHHYEAVFNPARADPNLPRHHMPKRFWRDLPEAKIISELLDSAEGRTDRMIHG